MNETHEEALRSGQTKYYTGEPCKRGHNTYRYTCSDYCVECNKEDTRRHRSTRKHSSKWKGPHKIGTARQASRAGRTQYYTGIPCSRGHSSARYVKGGGCCECRAEDNITRRERLMGPALVPVTIRVPGNQAQALRAYAALLVGMGGTS